MERKSQTVSLYGMFERQITGMASADSAVIARACEMRSEDGRRWELPAFRLRKDVYAVRFMPEKEGEYQYRLLTDARFAGEEAEDGGTGSAQSEGVFTCAGREAGNHGPVRPQGDGFVYADGTKYLPFGTTCYAWTHQSEALQEETLRTLGRSCFNKLRMLLFPKYMPYNHNDPEVYPFERDENGAWQVDRIVPAYWDNLDRRIRQLGELGIEADLILFHPYDKWGFAKLSQEASMRYLAYCSARLGAHRNVFWSLANEYEMVAAKSMEDWDAYGRFLQGNDPYRHPVSIHQILHLYPKKDWMTHLSIQSGNIDFIPTWKKEYGGIPVIIDECGYEGNIEYDWGNLSAFDMVDRFWQSVTRGGYCTHGETFHREDEVLWWGKGGVLHGESEPRIRFLRELLEELPGVGKADTPPLPRTAGTAQSAGTGNKPSREAGEEAAAQNPNAEKNGKQSEADRFFMELIRTTPMELLGGILAMSPHIRKGEGWQLRYLGKTCPYCTHLDLPEDGAYRIEVIDVWTMTRTQAVAEAHGHTEVRLPARPGVAVLARRV